MGFHEPQNEKDGAEDRKSESEGSGGNDEGWIRPRVGDETTDLLDVPCESMRQRKLRLRSRKLRTVLGEAWKRKKDDDGRKKRRQERGEPVEVQAMCGLVLR